MRNFTVGDTRITLDQAAASAAQANGSLVIDSERTRPLYFDGRFLSARDLKREQNYFLQAQSDLAQTAGFGVLHGLQVVTPTVNSAANDGQTLIIRSGSGTTPAGERVMLPSDLTIHLSDLPDEQNLDSQFNLSGTPNNPLRNRSGVYALALRPVEFTANPIASYPTSLQGSRTTHDGDIVEATAVALVPWSSPVNAGTWANGSMQDASLVRANLARQIFFSTSATTLSTSLLPIAMVSLQSGIIQWIDSYLLRRDTGPQYSGLRLGLTDPATQQAYLQQYDAQLREIVATRTLSGTSASFAATDYLRGLPPAGFFPLASISITSQNTTQTFSQAFFPQQLDVRLGVVPIDEIPALIEDAMSLPPIDLTLPADAYADLSVFALIPVPRAGFTALKNSLPALSPNLTLPRVLSFRTPSELLNLYRGSIGITQPTPSQNSPWSNAIGSQTYGFFVRCRTSPAYINFATGPVT